MWRVCDASIDTIYVRLGPTRPLLCKRRAVSTETRTLGTTRKGSWPQGSKVPHTGQPHKPCFWVCQAGVYELKSCAIHGGLSVSERSARFRRGGRAVELAALRMQLQPGTCPFSVLRF